MVFQVALFVAQIAAAYILSRLTARDGPRLTDLSPSSGDYGVPIPRVYGEAIRIAPPIMAQADLKETVHKHDGGLLGDVLGGVLGNLLPSPKTYTYSVTLALLLADRTDDDPIEGIGKIWANGKVIFNPAETPPTNQITAGTIISALIGKNRFYKSLTLYTGTGEQMPDPVLAAALGLGPQPGYRHYAYLVIEDLELQNFGNQVPQIEVLVKAKSGQTLADVAEAICAHAGIDDVLNMSSTAMIHNTVRGYAITAETNCWDALKPLMPVYRVDVAENAGQIRFFKREQPWRATVPANDMGGHEWGSEAPEHHQVQRTVDIDLPRATSLTFLDPARDWQANTASSRRSEGDARSNIALSLALSLTAEEGAKAAATIHWDAWLGRSRAAFSLTDQWIGITPGVAYALPFGDRLLPYRVTRKTRGANGIIEVEALSDERVIYQATVPASSGAALPPEESTLFADTVVVPMDMPIQHDTHDDFGFYITVGGSQPYWMRGAVEVSIDAGATWYRIDVTTSAVMGDVVGTLASGSTTGLDDTLDTVSVLTVDLLHSGMTLSSATDAELDAWANTAFVGKDGVGEYVQFKTATQTGPTIWELTNLRRGRRGTDHALGTHVSGEQFVLLGEGGVYRIDVPNSSGWGNPLVLRGVTLHQDGDDAAEVAFANTGEGKRPFSPIELAGSFVGSDLVLTWTDRSRFYGTDLDLPLEYEVEIREAGTLVRTVTGIATEGYTYLAADQSSDGFTDGDAIHVTVYRVNDDYGRSRGRVAAFIAAGFEMHMEDDTTLILMEDGVTPIGLG